MAMRQGEATWPLLQDFPSAAISLTRLASSALHSLPVTHPLVQSASVRNVASQGVPPIRPPLPASHCGQNPSPSRESCKRLINASEALKGCISPQASLKSLKGHISARSCRQSLMSASKAPWKALQVHWGALQVHYKGSQAF